MSTNLLKRALVAVEDVFSNTKVSREKTASDLMVLRDDINEKLDNFTAEEKDQD